MKRVYPDDTWSDLWHNSYRFDLEEVYESISNRGYAYAYQSRRDITLQLVTSYLTSGSTILDVAAAQGNFSLSLAEMGYHVTWNDLRGDLAEYVKLKRDSGSVQYAVGDVFELGFEAAFDAVLITEIIEHVAHPDQFLRKIAKMVRPGGYIFMTTPNGAYIRNSLPRFSDCENPSQFESIQFKPDGDGHIFLLWPDEIVSLGHRSGLEVVDCRFLTNPLTNGHMKTAGLLKVFSKKIIFDVERWLRRLPEKLQHRLMVQVAVCYRRT